MNNLECPRKRRFKATTDSKHDLPVAENILDRKFDVEAPNVAWATDITYVWTDEGWLYLAVILDLFAPRGRLRDERPDSRPLSGLDVGASDMMTRAVQCGLARCQTRRAAVCHASG